MPDFDDVVKHLDINKARQATADEAAQATIPFDKFYSLKRARDIKKINTVIILPAFSYVATSQIAKLYRLMFQYNVSMPQDFYILNANPFYKSTEASSVAICVRYRIGTQVFRYNIGGRPLDHTTDGPGIFPNNLLRFPWYNQEVIKKNCVFEVWRFNWPGGTNAGIIQDWHVNTSLLSNPATADDTELDLTQTVIAQPAIGITIPASLPFVNTTNAWLTN